MSSAPPIVSSIAPEAAVLRKPPPPGPRFIESFTWMFESPQWFLNLLLVTLLVNLLPILGQIAAMGYFFVAIGEHLESPRFGYHDLDLARFVDYLKRGLRPWVVQIVATFLGIPIALLCYLPLFVAAIGLLNTGDEMSSLLGGFLMGVAYIIYIGLLTVVSLAPIPLIFRVGLTGDFRDALKIRWAFQYFRLLAPEIFWVTPLFILAMFPLMFLGLLACLVGIWFVVGWGYFSAFRLLLQLYELFLARGGEPIPLPTPSKVAA
jgi:hypothetical protein